MSESWSAGERPLAQLAGVRLANDHRPGSLETTHDLGILGGRPDIPVGAERGGHPSNVAVPPAARRRSAAAASAKADSVSTTRKAFSVDWLTSMACSDRRTSSA